MIKRTHLKVTTQPTSLRLLVGALLLAMLFSTSLRLIAANYSVYFDKDEVRKLMRTSGFTVPQIQSQLMSAEPMTAGGLVDRYQYACSRCAEAPSLAALEANREHPPLYYLLLQKWLGLFGQWLSPKVFATLVTLVTLPALYWLAVELFDDWLAGLISVTIFAVSPLMFTVSQHVSQYSLLALLSCLSTTCFIRAHRSEKKIDWVLYSFLVSLGLYTHLFFVLLPAAHGLYELLRWNLQRLRSFLLAVAIAGLSFLPWMVGIVGDYRQFEDTTGMETSPVLENPPAVWTYFANGMKFTVQLFLKKDNISLLSNDWLDSSLASGVAIVAFIGITGWLLHYRRFHNSFLLLLACLWVPTVPIMVLDVFLVQGISAKVRYYLPTVVIMLPLLGFWLASGVRSPFLIRRRLVSLGLLLILMVSLASSGKLFVLTLSDRASGSQYGSGYQQAANIANQVANKDVSTLVISYEDYIQSLVFVHRLNVNTHYLMREGRELSHTLLSANIKQYRDHYSQIFILSPSQSQVENLKAAGIAYQGIPERWNVPVLYQILPVDSSIEK